MYDHFYFVWSLLLCCACLLGRDVCSTFGWVDINRGWWKNNTFSLIYRYIWCSLSLLYTVRIFQELLLVLERFISFTLSLWHILYRSYLPHPQVIHFAKSMLICECREGRRIIIEVLIWLCFKKFVSITLILKNVDCKNAMFPGIVMPFLWNCVICLYVICALKHTLGRDVPSMWPSKQFLIL